MSEDIEQPDPIVGRQPVAPALRDLFNQSLTERTEIGIERYGRPLETHNGRDAGRDAFEEWIDLGQYLQQLRMEHEELKAEVARLRKLEMELMATHQTINELRAKPNHKKLSEDDLETLWYHVRTKAPQAGDIYVHNKTGKRYAVDRIALRESDLEPLVIYRRMPSPVGDAINFARPVSEWRERFTKEG